jgi:predicted  nucleic acid-binding Zn-ribbon protein
MKATPSDQSQILDIQQMDFALATLQHKMASLPEIGELLGVTARLAVVRDLAVAAQTEISDIARELLRSEADVEQVASRLEKDEKRLTDGSAGAKELEKLQHEIATLTGRRSELEEIELEIMMRIDSIKDRLTELRTEETLLTGQAADLVERKEIATREYQRQVDSINAERLATTQSVDGTLVDLYEKIRASNNGTGAAILKEGRCDGCHLAINSVELSRMKTLAAEEVVRCEECRCILVRGAK